MYLSPHGEAAMRCVVSFGSRSREYLGEGEFGWKGPEERAANRIGERANIYMRHEADTDPTQNEHTECTLYLLSTQIQDDLGVFLLVLSGEAAEADANSLEGLGPTGS